MWIVFFAALLLTAVCSLYFIRYSGGKKMPLIMTAAVCGAALAVIGGGIADLFIDAWEFDGVFALMGTVMAAEVMIFTLLQKKNSRTLRFMGKLLLGAAIIEMTLFQLPSYRLMLGNYPRLILSAADGELYNCEYDLKSMGVPVKGLSEASISYHNLNVPIGTVYVNVAFADEDSRCFTILGDMNDETGKYYRLGIMKGELISCSETSKYSVMQLSGKTESARFRISGVEEETSCIIRNFEFNRPIPFDVSPLRLLLVTVLGTFIYACLFSPIMKRKFSENRYVCRMATLCLTLLTMYSVILIVLTEIPTGEFFDQFRQTTGDQITEELVLTFEKGQFNLPYDVEHELLAMDNPYDSDARTYEDIPFLWDHVLFDGKYYSYYGVAPLLLFVPYHLLTGYFFPTNIAVMLFSCIGVIFLALIYRTIVKKWFSDISTTVYVSGLAIIFAASGVWFSAGRPCFYEISISSGLACAAAGIYYLLTANIVSEGKLSLRRTAVSSLLIGLAVLCRPTLALYAICACVWYLFGYRKAKGGKGVKKMPVKYMLCAALPMVMLGAFQMWYNYSRFGSVLDFGIQYSLTVNDFTRSEYHVPLMLIGLYNFLLAPPAFIPEYPYVAAPFSMLRANGFYFKDDGGASGVLFLALPVFGYLLAGKALKKIKGKGDRLKWLTLIGLPCIVMPVIIVCSVWESGYSARYMSDFSWQIIIGALAILYFLYMKCGNRTIKRIFSAAMAFCAVYSVVVCGIEAFNFSLPKEYYPHYADALARLIDPMR